MKGSKKWNKYLSEQQARREDGTQAMLGSTERATRRERVRAEHLWENIRGTGRFHDMTTTEDPRTIIGDSLVRGDKAET